MKNVKKIVTIVLSACAVLSCILLTACNNGNTGGETVTTVANETEWQKALDLFSFNNFSMRETDSYEDGVTINGNIDLVNFKANFTSETEWANRYFEYSENNIWEWEYGEDGAYKNQADDSNVKEQFEGILTNIDSNHIVVTLALLQLPMFVTASNNTDLKALPDLFSEFTYEEGVYISDSIRMPEGDMTVKTEIYIKDGVISEFKMELGEAEDLISYTAEFSNINSATVTTPAEARAAIDAEKSKG